MTLAKEDYNSYRGQCSNCNQYVDYITEKEWITKAHLRCPKCDHIDWLKK